RFSDLFAGEYDIRLTLDDYEDQVTQVTIKPDQEDSLNFTLTAKPLGSLTVLAVILEDDSEIPNQVANIFVNGEEYGQTPRSFQLKSGEYTVTAKMFDHTAENVEQKVTILSGVNTTIKFKFIKN
ncbi:MAG: PEGA domain-containing protein, partial [bacterium]